jgi:putative CocE/NonD family hydrolase
MHFWGNWHDEPTGQMILAAENLDGRLLLGPGNHCVPPPGIDFAGIVQQFFDEHLRDVAPSEPQPRVRWWLEGEGVESHWQQSERWPGVEMPRETWYLAAAARGRDTGEFQLQTRPARTSRPRFAVDYEVATGDYFAFWVDSQHGRGLSFTTEPLAAEHELIGFTVVHLRVASDRPEPLLFAYLEQLAPDGSAEVIAFGRLAAAYRRTGTAPYDTLGLPWHTGTQSDHAPLVPGREVELSFALTPTSRVIDAGARLRLVVTGADPRQRNLEEIRLDPPPLTSLVLGGRTGSRVELPLRPLSAQRGATPLAAAETGR